MSFTHPLLKHSTLTESFCCRTFCQFQCILDKLSSKIYCILLLKKIKYVQLLPDKSNNTIYAYSTVLLDKSIMIFCIQLVTKSSSETQWKQKGHLLLMQWSIIWYIHVWIPTKLHLSGCKIAILVLV